MRIQSGSSSVSLNLVSTWPASATCDQFGSSSMPPMSVSTPSSPLPELDHTSSLLAVSPPPAFGQLSYPPSHRNLVPLIDSKAIGHHEHGRSPVVCISCLLLYVVEIHPFSLSPCLVHIRMTKAESSNPVSGTFHNGYKRISATCTSVKSLSRCV